MTAGDLERFRKAEEVFYAALEMAAGPDRDRLIGDRCGRDAELQAKTTNVSARPRLQSRRRCRVSAFGRR